MCIWNMETGESKVLSIEPETTYGEVMSVAISPDGRFVVAGSSDSVIRIWDVASGELVEHLKGHNHAVRLVAFLPDGHGLVSRSYDMSLKYWDLTELGHIVPRPGMGVVQGLQQSQWAASNSMSLPPDTKDGRGDCGSPCTVAFEGHEVCTFSHSDLVVMHGRLGLTPSTGLRLFRRGIA